MTAANETRKPCVICVGGSATIDQIFLVDEVKLPSVKITATDFVETGGGMGANAAVTVQRLGGRASYWGRVGDDETGDQVIALLKHEGVDVSTVLRLSGFRTKIATILIDKRGERLVVSVQPQGYPPDASWLPIERVADADAVLADTRWPAGAQRLFDAAAMAGKPSVFDGDAGDPRAGARDRAARDASVSVAIDAAEPADGRAERCTAEVVRRTQRRVRRNARRRGRDVVRWQAVSSAPSPRVKAVDTLAAGDTWHGAFALALAERKELRPAIEFATAVAAMKCTRFGGRAGIPKRDQFERWWASLERN